MVSAIDDNSRRWSRDLLRRSLAQADVDAHPRGRGNEAKKLIAMELPIAVVPGSTRPLEPLSGLSFPALLKTRLELSCSEPDPELSFGGLGNRARNCLIARMELQCKC